MNTCTSAVCTLASFILQYIKLHQNKKKNPCLVLAVQVRKFNPDFPKIANGTLHQGGKKR